jgi:hypothetical protein
MFSSIVAFVRAYRAVAWQRVDKIRYNTVLWHENPLLGNDRETKN